MSHSLHEWRWSWMVLMSALQFSNHKKCALISLNTYFLFKVNTLLQKNPKAHRLWCLHPVIDLYTLNYNFTVTSRCDPAAFTLRFSSKPHREGRDRIFGERFQYEKSPSGDEKSSLPLTSKRPHCSLTLKYVSIYLLLMWDIWGSAAWGGG